jgi:hypothetical protein
MKTIATPKKSPVPKSKPAPVQGEGNYKAARRHRASVEKFVKSGQVEVAAREAEPKTPVEEAEMFDAERVGEERSKGEDPAP